MTGPVLRTALVTGANRGLGRALAAELSARGITVYGAARDPDGIDLPGVTPVRFDLADPDTIHAAARQAHDVDLLVNNAGSFSHTSLLHGDLAGAHADMGTHYFGNLATIRAFAPVLARNGGGAILNVLSVLSWVSSPTNGGYCAAKAAAWSMTNSLRLELQPQRTQVTALHVGLIDTGMVAGVAGSKAAPRDVARFAIEGVLAGDSEVIYPDAWTTSVRRALSEGVPALYPGLR